MKSLISIIVSVFIVNFIYSLRLNKDYDVTQNITISDNTINSDEKPQIALLTCNVKHCSICRNDLINQCKECDDGFKLIDTKCYSKILFVKKRHKKPWKLY